MVGSYIKEIRALVRSRLLSPDVVVYYSRATSSMPRRKKGSGRKNRRGARGANLANTVTLSCTDIADVGFSSSFSFSAIAMKPSNIDRLSSIAPNFELYRFKHMSAQLLPAVSGTKPVSCAFLDVTTTSTPTGHNYVTIGEMPNSATWYPGQVKPVNITHKTVNSQTWLRTTDLGGVTGYLLVGTDSGIGLVCWARITVVIEFKEPMANAKPLGDEFKGFFPERFPSIRKFGPQDDLPPDDDAKEEFMTALTPEDDIGGLASQFIVPSALSSRVSAVNRVLVASKTTVTPKAETASTPVPKGKY